MNRHFVCNNGIIWAIYENGDSNFNRDFRVIDDTVQVLGEKDGKDGGRLIEDEYVLWDSLTELALEIESDRSETFSVDQIRQDLRFQLDAADELDWNYFVETAIRARHKANLENVNFTSL
jgi:hypothetical protein